MNEHSLYDVINKGCRVGFFGIGESNLSLLRALPLQNCEITLRSDKRIAKDLIPKDINPRFVYDRDASTSSITEDVMFFSPSVKRDRPEFSDAASRGVVFSSDAELFFESNKAPLFSVTGSDGKSTLSTMLHLMLSRSQNTGLVGNIGTPMFESLSKGHAAYVAELSSFMLEYSTPHSKRATVTNITPNHLDFHKSYECYRDRKLGLLQKADECVLSADDDQFHSILKNGIFAITSAEKSFSQLRELYPARLYVTLEGDRILKNGEFVIALSDIKRREIYNLKNLMGAIAMSDGYADAESIRHTAKSFSGLPHRCRFLGTFSGIEFYDSSIDSTPSRTAQTLSSLGKRTVIILGGRGKCTPYAELCEPLSSFAECAVITGENADEIYSAVKDCCPTVMVDNFDDAVKIAKNVAKKCGRVLLSPASTSYDSFNNYRERGEKFKALIECEFK